MTPNPNFQLSWQAFSLPKGGNSSEELEDAFEKNVEAGRFAVADGATESICSDIWARLIVDKLVTEPLPAHSSWTDWLAGPRQSWWNEVRCRALSMYAEHKLEQGASAALIGLQLHPHGSWNAVGLGDSCLFHWRKEQLIQSFPLTKSREFSNRPVLASTQWNGNDVAPFRLDGTWQLGDCFTLMTDALAQYVLMGVEKNNDGWNQLERLLDVIEDQPRLEEEVSRLKILRRLRNDDVTLLAIQL